MKTLRYSNDKPVMVGEGMESQAYLEFTYLVRGEAGTEREKEVCLLRGEDSSAVGFPHRGRERVCTGGEEGPACFC